MTMLRKPHILTSAFSNIRKLAKDESGNYAIIFSLCLTSLLMAGGGALDYSNSFRLKSELKDALDAAVLGAIAQKSDENEQIELAKKIFAANTEAFGGNIDDVTFSHGSDGELIGTVEGHAPTELLKLARIDTLSLDVSSAAIVGPQSGEPLCIMAMHPTRKHTLELKGSVSVYGPDCHIYGNSNDYDDVVDPHTPENFMTGASVQAVGYGHHYIQNVTPPLQRVREPIPDPYLSMSLPKPGICDFYNTQLKGGSHTLDPGTYCGGLEVEKSADVTLNPGLYVIIGGKFVVDESNVQGDGVTIMLGDSKAEMELQDATLRLVAPVSGKYESFVMMGVREETEHTIENSTADLYGIIYLPNGAFEWDNDGTPNITAEWAAWITDGFSWTGTGTINFPYKTKGAKVPHPSTLNVIPRPNIKDVVRLIY